jgi:hypothetical protein
MLCTQNYHDPRLFHMHKNKDKLWWKKSKFNLHTKGIKNDVMKYEKLIFNLLFIHNMKGLKTWNKMSKAFNSYWCWIKWK